MLSLSPINQLLVYVFSNNKAVDELLEYIINSKSDEVLGYSIHFKLTGNILDSLLALV